jgi:cell surface protein SprA
MSQEEYKDYRLKKDMFGYFKEKINATNPKRKESKEAQKNLLPKYYVNSKFFETIFGGNEIEVIPSGSLQVRMGMLFQNVDNPQISENNRQTSIFDFMQEVGVGVRAKIGKRLEFGAQYDTQSSFSFQNRMNLGYEPEEDAIVRNIEVGNVNMAFNNSLILGSQSLFGVKTELQFGKTYIKSVYAQQQSQTKSVNATAGAVIEEFQIQATDYDENRHFFLSQYFRDNYDRAMVDFPLINSRINITRVEVWVTNRNNTTENVRNIVALADLGEGDPLNIQTSAVTVNLGVEFPSNESNDLNTFLQNDTGTIREIPTVRDDLSTFSMAEATDYSVLENAIKLKPNEFNFHPQLGYISLNRRLADADVLAVAFEYTNTQNELFKVGEFTTDGITPPKNLIVKLLRSEIISTNTTTWDLMMKNIYSLQAYQMTQSGLRLELLYNDDEIGVPINFFQNAATSGLSERSLMNIFKIDRLDQSFAEVVNGDGYFDYVEGITVNSEKGQIIFPTIEPFGESLTSTLTAPSDEIYIFDELYRNIKITAKNDFQTKDKYLIKGTLETQQSGGIPLGAFNVPRGSVQVTSDGRQLVEGVDFVVDYQIGRVQIINPALESSNAPIQVSVESNAVFNQQNKRFMGVDVTHQFSDDFIAGASILNLNERPLTNKVNFGQETTNNTMIGLNAALGKEAPILTKWANKLPNFSTDAPSNFNIKSEIAYLHPGAPKAIRQGGQATAYLDDFEGSQIPIQIATPTQWFLAGTPQFQTQFDLNGNANDLSYGFKRAKLAWYAIDPLFYGIGNLRPGSIGNDELSRQEVRSVFFSELFPEQQLEFAQFNLLRTFDLAYYPNERGSYNFDTNNVDTEDKFTDPEDRWGGISRPLSTTNFEQANVESIQFWMLDPWYGENSQGENYGITQEEGLPSGVNPTDVSNQVGELYFNLGNISEDILKDGRKQFENGLPENDADTDFAETTWGRVPTKQSILYAFEGNDVQRNNQDIGLDGLSDEDEVIKFGNSFGDDPSSDNYQFFRSSEYDNVDASILTRYKDYNNTQGNSNTVNSDAGFSSAYTNVPDVEDINRDQTMNTVESYYQYKISLNKNDMEVGSRHVVDEKFVDVTLENGTTQRNRWVQYRIQIKSPDEVIGNISGFNAIRFMRIFLTKFKMPVVLRFAEFQLIRGDWRKFTNNIPEIDLQQELQEFEVGAVNIIQNEIRTPIPYVLPPGIQREVLQTPSVLQQQNEQSLSLKVKDLEPGEIRSIFKNIAVDLRMYKRLKLFLHAEAIQGTDLVGDNELKAIVRLGSDLEDNYYQIEMPLNISDFSATRADEVWLPENNIDVDLSEFGKIKLQRLTDGAVLNQLYPAPSTLDNGMIVRVKGSPNLSNIRAILLGVENSSLDDQSAEVWFNELRVSEYNNEGGFSGIVNADANIADFANISLTGRLQTTGFGSIDQTVNERSQEDAQQYNLATSMNLGNLLPKKLGINLPMNYTISEEVRSPKYDPQYQDALFEDAEDINPNSENAKSYSKRRSISFVNVSKQRTGLSNKKPNFYDVENLNFSYAYNEEFQRDYNIEKNINQNVNASASYNYSFTEKSIQPFKKVKFLNDSKLKFIKDFNINLLPNSVSANGSINRTSSEQLSRALIPGSLDLPALKQRNFMLDWDYRIAHNLTKSIQLNFNAGKNSIHDDFESDEDPEIFDDFFNFGRPNNYQQSLTGTYRIPLDKFPFMDFMNADYSYAANFNWQGAPEFYVDQVGNTISNSNNQTLGLSMDFNKFYKNTQLEQLFILKTKEEKERIKKNKALQKARKNNPKKSNSKNSRRRRRVRKKSINSKNVKVLGGNFGKTIYGLLTSVKKARFNYTESNQTSLPGYIPQVGFLGRESINNTMAPGLGFVFGSQRDIRQQAVENGWLISRSASDPYANRTFIQSHTNSLDMNMTVEPIKGLSIQLKGNKSYSRNTNQQMDVVDGVLVAIPDNDNGGFGVSYNMLGTSFENFRSVFETFRENRKIISRRLAESYGLDPNDLNGDYVNGFGQTSQEVVIPAFLASYSGKSVHKIKLNPFRDIPIPSWQFNYRGLMKLKWFKSNFRNFSLSHRYNSSYEIDSYISNLAYDVANPFSDDNKDPISGNFKNRRLFSNINLTEDFSPLIGMDIRLKNALSLTGRINKRRALNLSFDNNTISQDTGVEYIFGLGYRIKDVVLNFIYGEEKIKLKGDINIRADLSVRDTQTSILTIDDDNEQVTGGQRLFSFKLFADYAMNKNLTASFYYDQNSSVYAISTTFPRQSISSGFSVRYLIGN